MPLLFDSGVVVGKVEKLPSGWLRVPARISRIGVFSYPSLDRQILRLPEEVFHKDSLQSFDLAPLTNEHPPTLDGKLSSENIKQFQVGQIGNVRKDGDYVEAQVMITDPQVVKLVENKEKNQVSCGYDCDIEDSTGTWKGIHYDGIARKIRGNHVAITSRGRAGPEVKLLVDSAQDKEMGMPLKVIKIGNREVTIADTADAAQLQQIVTEIEQTTQILIQEKDKQIAEKIALADAAESELKKVNAEFAVYRAPETERARVEGRVKLENDAHKIAPTLKCNSLSDSEIYQQAIKAYDPDADIKRPVEGLKAYFEACVVFASKSRNIIPIPRALTDSNQGAAKASDYITEYNKRLEASQRKARGEK